MEDRHFWFVSRAELIFDLARRLADDLGPGSLILEAGCGNGTVLRVLRKAYPDCTVAGMDLWFEGLRHARTRGNSTLVQGDVRQSPFGRQFDLVAIFDVLEHLPDDIGMLNGLNSLLRPGGILLITVPAHMSLWSYFDQASHHCRRYAVAELRAKLIQSGYEVQFLTSFMATLFPLVWLGRRLSSLFGSRNADRRQRVRELAENDLRIIPLANGILRGILRLENRWISSGRSLPIGTSLLAIARKPE